MTKKIIVSVFNVMFCFIVVFGQSKHSHKVEYFERNENETERYQNQYLQNESTYFDRFGNKMPFSSISRDYSRRTGINRSGEVEAGHFVLHYVEPDGVGFNAPENIEFRMVLEQVARDLSVLIAAPPVDPCTGLPAKAHIKINPTDVTFGNNVVASSSINYKFPTLGYSVMDGEVWKVLNTGVASDNGIFHGELIVNFNGGHNFYTTIEGFENDMTTGQLDLYSTVLHEFIHLLGFGSMIGENGYSKYYEQVGAFYYSRFDILLNNGSPVLYSPSSTNSQSLFYDLYSAINNSVVTNPSCSNITVKPGQSLCGEILLEGYSVYTPAEYVDGSSLSHIRNDCPDENQNLHNFVMDFVTLPEQFSRRITKPEIEILNAIGYQTTGIFGSDPNSTNYVDYHIGTTGKAIGGVDDKFDCNHELIYRIEACQDSKLNIPVLQNDNNNPTGITGLVLVTECEASVSADVNNNVIYNPDPNYYGLIEFQYIPVYDNCALGNITTVGVYNIPCGAQDCGNIDNQICELICNGDVFYYQEVENLERRKFFRCQDYDAVYQSLHYYKVPNWEDAMGTCDVLINNSTENNLIGFLGTETPMFKFNFVKNRTYKISFDYMLACDNYETMSYPLISNLNAILIKKDFIGLPYFGHDKDSYVYIESILENQDYLRVFNLSGDDVSAVSNSELTTFNKCIEADDNYDYIVFYVVLNNGFGTSLLDNVIIIDPNETWLPDVQMSACDGTVDVSLCADMTNPDFQWAKTSDPNTILATGNDVTLTETGEYTFTFLDDNNEVCFTDNFEVLPSEDGFLIEGTIQDIICERPGSIVLQITTNDYDNLSYYWHETGETTSNILVDNPGTYTVTVSNTVTGCVSSPKTFEVNHITEPDFAVILTANAPTCYENGYLKADVLTINGGVFQYKWNTGATNDQIAISDGGDYWVEVSDQNGCLANKPINIELEYDDRIEVEISGQREFCSEYLLTSDLSINHEVGDIQWKLNGANIAGATSDTYTATEKGTYTVQITTLNCTYVSPEFVIVTGVCCVAPTDASAEDPTVYVPPSGYTHTTGGILPKNPYVPYLIEGTLTITSPTILMANEVIFGEFGQIHIMGNGSLTIKNPPKGTEALLALPGIYDFSYLHGCTEMWKGIIVSGEHASLTINSNVVIEDAKKAIYAANDARIDIQEVTFNKNRIGIELNNYSIEGQSDKVTIRGCTFDCTSLPIEEEYVVVLNSEVLPEEADISIGIRPYDIVDGNTEDGGDILDGMNTLKSPYEGEISFSGIVTNWILATSENNNIPSPESDYTSVTYDHILINQNTFRRQSTCINIQNSSLVIQNNFMRPNLGYGMFVYVYEGNNIGIFNNEIQQFSTRGLAFSYSNFTDNYKDFVQKIQIVSNTIHSRFNNAVGIEIVNNSVAGETETNLFIIDDNDIRSDRCIDLIHLPSKLFLTRNLMLSTNRLQTDNIACNVYGGLNGFIHKNQFRSGYYGLHLVSTRIPKICENGFYYNFYGIHTEHAFIQPSINLNNYYKSNFIDYSPTNAVKDLMSCNDLAYYAVTPPSVNKQVAEVNLLRAEIYPNPTNGNFTIKHNFSNPALGISLKIFDVYGKLVHQKTYVSALIQDQLPSELPDGVYYVQIHGNNSLEQINSKLILLGN